MSRLAKILPIFYLLVDVIILCFSFISSTYIYNQNYQYEAYEWNILSILVVLWLIIGYPIRLYKLNLHNGYTLRLVSYVKSYFAFVLIISLIFLSSNSPIAVGSVFTRFVVAFIILDVTMNFIVVNIISRFRRRQTNIKHTLVAGVGELAAEISRHFNSNPDYGFQISAYLSVNGEECKVNQKLVVGTLDNLKEYLDHHLIDEIVIALPSIESTQSRLKYIIDEADHQGVRVSCIPDYQGLFGKHFKAVTYGQLEAVNIHRFPLDGVYAVIGMGAFNIIFSAFVLVLLSPLLLVIAAIIKLDSRGPILYCPIRAGRGGKDFKVFKFRTMKENDAPSGGTLSTIKNDPRITKVGRILRKYNLDELPQFFNVLIGDMSVVGPRPHRNFLNQQMKDHVDKYMIRHYFKPGITGWAQVNGWRGPTETDEQINQRTAHDLWYIENWSFILDLKIIWLTVFGKKSRQNAF